VIPRSLAPERVYDVSNGILLSKHEHALARAELRQVQAFEGGFAGATQAMQEDQ